MGLKMHRRRAALYAAAAAVAVMAGHANAVDTVFVGPPGGNWDVDANWRNAGPDGIYGNADDVFVQPPPFSAGPPTVADAAVVLDGSTVNLNTAETILELQASVPQHAGDTNLMGVARVNIGPGAALVTNGNSSGIRLGRQLDAGQAVGTSRGEIVQTGGTVVIQQGANGLRMSQADSGNVGDSLYRISGGSVRGGAGADGTMLSDLRLGAIANVWDEAEFHVVGSAPTSIRFLDVQAAANSAENGDSIFHFSLDAGGVTPIVAEDEFQFRGDATNGLGNNLLEIDLIALAPQSDITLVIADRLNTNGVASGPANEHFTNYLDGDVVTADFGTTRYFWNIDYTDAPVPPQTSADDGVLDASIVLRFNRVEAIPEPSGLALIALAGLAAVRRRRRDVR